ncbi:hypothetical protein VTI74DRAFT_2083 [Chaetomium olivicolor]
MPLASSSPRQYPSHPTVVGATNAHLPRLLCLHGGGTTAAIFRRQCRSLVRAFAPHFRLVFADAPYLADAPGADATALAAVYPPARYGPFRCWLRRLPEHLAPQTLVGDDEPAVVGDANAEAVAAIEWAMRKAMTADDEAGGQGEWVGLVGFSQGAKVAASVLFETQVRRDARASSGETKYHFAGADWRFGVLLAGRAPLVGLSELSFALEGFELPASYMCGLPPVAGDYAWNRHRLRLPTVQVHGLADPGLRFHRALYADFTAPGSAELVEWEGDHRVAIKPKDVQCIVQATLRAAKRAGVYLHTLRGDILM